METDAAKRKALPLARGCLDYFPDALLEVASCSLIANEQHNPGEPLHWAKEKSQDEADALLRHLIERGTYDTDGIRHSAKVAWRALALLQRELDAEAEAPQRVYSKLKPGEYIEVLPDETIDDAIMRLNGQRVEEIPRDVHVIKRDEAHGGYPGSG